MMSHHSLSQWLSQSFPENIQLLSLKNDFSPHALPSQSVFLFSPPFYYPQQFSLMPSHICNIVTEAFLSSLFKILHTPYPGKPNTCCAESEIIMTWLLLSMAVCHAMLLPQQNWYLASDNLSSFKWKGLRLSRDRHVMHYCLLKARKVGKADLTCWHGFGYREEANGYACFWLCGYRLGEGTRDMRNMPNHVFISFVKMLEVPSQDRFMVSLNTHFWLHVIKDFM